MKGALRSLQHKPFYGSVMLLQTRWTLLSAPCWVMHHGCVWYRFRAGSLQQYLRWVNCHRWLNAVVGLFLRVVSSLSQPGLGSAGAGVGVTVTGGAGGCDTLVTVRGCGVHEEAAPLCRDVVTTFLSSY